MLGHATTPTPTIDARTIGPESDPPAVNSGTKSTLQICLSRVWRPVPRTPTTPSCRTTGYTSDGQEDELNSCHWLCTLAAPRSSSASTRNSDVARRATKMPPASTTAELGACG